MAIRDIREDIGSALADGTGVEVVPVMSLLLFDELCLVLCFQSTVVVVGVGSGGVASFFQIVRWLFVAAALEIYAHNTTCVISLSLCFCALLWSRGL